MSADNETLLEIVNSISNDLTGADAQTSGVQPIKSNIIEKVNDKQKDVCNSRDWTFLMDTASLNAYNVTTTEATNDPVPTSAGQPADLKSDETGGKTSYWAEKITNVAGYLAYPKQIDVMLVATATGAGAVSGSFQFLICPDSGGNPDIANPVVTGAVNDSTIFSGLTAAAFENYILGSITTNAPLLKSTAYWIVLKFVGAADNGDGLAVEYGSVASSTTKTRLNNATTWTAFTTGRLRVKLTYYQADYLSTITLPITAKKVYRLYTDALDAPTLNLLPYSNTKLISYPDDVPTGYFVVRSMTSGQQEIWINPETQATVYTMEYKKNCVALVNDGDYPLIPTDYRPLLKKGVLLYYITVLGLGMQDSGAIALLQTEYDKMLKDMRTEFLPNPMISMGAGRRSVPSTDNRWARRDPNSWSVK